jgi:hypothetical protein
MADKPEPKPGVELRLIDLLAGNRHRNPFACSIKPKIIEIKKVKPIDVNKGMCQAFLFAFEQGLF